MKTKAGSSALKEEAEALNEKRAELTGEELEPAAGGRGPDGEAVLKPLVITPPAYEPTEPDTPPQGIRFY